MYMFIFLVVIFSTILDHLVATTPIQKPTPEKP